MASRGRWRWDGYACLRSHNATSTAEKKADRDSKHPVAGATGKWFAEKTIIGTKITEKIGKYPDPTQHWAVIVGDYVHQLWMVINPPSPPGWKEWNGSKSF